MTGFSVNDKDGNGDKNQGENKAEDKGDKKDAPQTPAAEQDNAPAQEAPAPAAEQDNTPARKGWLARIFNRQSLTTMAAGAVVGVTVKIAAVTALGSQAAALAIGAAAIGATSTIVKRAFDIHAYNKAHADDKAGYLRDFFNAAKTGHSTRDYGKHLAVASGFALLGGTIGFAVADWFTGGGDAPAPAPVTVDPGTDINGIVDQPVIDDGTVIVDPPAEEPVVEQPVVDEPVVDEPAVDEPVVDEPAVDETPVVDEPAVDEPAVDEPVVDEPAVDEPVVEEPVVDETPVAPTLDERVAATLDEVRGLLPAQPGRQLAEALARTESANELVRAQAIKDLGYFFANGFAGVTENDPLANRLFELAIEVSDGRNMQAVHDLGYQLLHGLGTTADHARAHELLSTSHAGGHRLSAPMLQYMNRMGLAPRP